MCAIVILWIIVFFASRCEWQNRKPGPITFDSNTGLITSLSVTGNGESTLRLNPNSPLGEYEGNDIVDIQSAAILQQQLASILTTIAFVSGSEDVYSYFDQSEKGYSSRFLKIPENIFNSDTQVTSTNYQQEFKLRAGNIVNGFGKTLRYCKVDEQGKLHYYAIEEGNACSYEYDSTGNYYPHNVDTIYQAAPLHSIGAAFINDCLKFQESEN